MPLDESERDGASAIGGGLVLGRYRLIAELARGGMGIVYLALLRGPGGFNKLFVVKELKSHLAEDPNLVAMFLEEARLAAKLNHPNVVQTIEIGSVGRRHFIAMEYLEGQSLHRMQSRARRTGRALPLQYHLLVIAQLLEGLEYAHGITDFDRGESLDLVHRDVSPHNVLVTYDGQIKVLDFGIAKALDSSHDTRTGVLKGKIAYMGPEQARGSAIDRRADVFSAGVMLWEAVVGRRMWGQAQNDLQILHALMRGEIPSPREAKPDIDPSLERIILKATAAEREQRYATAAELQSEIETYLKVMAVPPFGGRDVGKFFAEVFATERARIKTVVDEQLRLLRSAGTGEQAAFELPLLSSTSGAPSVTPSGVLLSTRSSSRPPATSSAPRAQHVTLPEAAVEQRLRESGPPAARSRRPVRVVLLGSAAVIAITAGAFVRPRPAASPATPPNVAGVAEKAQSTPASRARSTVRVLVTATPRDARITLDDDPPRNGSLEATLARDSAPHAVRIEAPRYQPRTLRFDADDDRAFDVALEPVREATAARPPPRGAHIAGPPPSAQSMPAPPVAAPPVTTTAPPVSAPPATTGRVRQPIDTRDPYAQ